MYIEAKSNRLRKELRAYLDHVMATSDRVLITRHGKEVAALVTMVGLQFPDPLCVCVGDRSAPPGQ